MKSIKQYIKESNEEVEDVIFRKEKDDDGKYTSIVAFFPNQHNGKYIGCYSHEGQHSDSDMGYYWSTKPATPEEYKDLYNELTKQVGYKLRVLKRMQHK